MKKFLALLFLLIPFKVSALDYGISKYNIDMDLIDNGDVIVTETFKLESEFDNGFEKELYYKNSLSTVFDGSEEAFNSGDIYNASDIEIMYVGVSSSFDSNFIESTKVNFASSGDVSKYIIYKEQDGYTVRIYNPSSTGNRVFKIQYKIKNAVVKHNDVAEFAWNIFNQSQRENIKELTGTIRVSNNKDDIRIFVNGPLHGSSSIVNMQEVTFNINSLVASVPLSVRVVFDKDATNTLKVTNTDGLAKILSVEQKKADSANAIREEARQKEAFRLFLGKIFDVIRVAYIFGLVYMIRNIYINHDKEYESLFTTDYYRDFPESYSPAIVGYLIDKKVNTNELSAVIMDMIQRKVILFDDSNKKKLLFKKNFEFKDKNVIVSNNKEINITSSENEVLEFLFKILTTSDTFTMQDINKFAKKNYDTFLTFFTDFKNLVINEGEEQQFFENKSMVKAKVIGYSVLGLVSSTVLINYNYFALISVILIFASVGAIIYFISFIKRTEKGNDQYVKWMGLKKFLNDFGNFSERELPQIHLWEKYLVYAVVFGNAKKLAKTMEVKFKELGYNDQTYPISPYYFHSLSTINHAVSQGVASAASTAAQVRASQNSSGSGMGGGFSSGGGSFGGGGGGGRF